MPFSVHWFMTACRGMKKSFPIPFFLPVDHYRQMFSFFTLKFFNSSAPSFTTFGSNSFCVIWWRVSYPVNLKRWKEESFARSPVLAWVWGCHLLWDQCISVCWKMSWHCCALLVLLDRRTSSSEKSKTEQLSLWHGASVSSAANK